ncbi:MAG: sensor domain-containing diguanylate cyclase, partial [Clostridia bacterium]|nr:sensor domain-containing diguanylate cyclase [Clostridia bacterium]
LSEAKAIGSFLSHSMIHVPAEDLTTHLESWLPVLTGARYGSAMSVLLLDRGEDVALHWHSGSRRTVTDPAELRALQREAAASPFCDTAASGDQELTVYATQDHLDAACRTYIYDLIHSLEYGADGYVWVNEIRSYEGGEGYAVRLIHPNVTETEGMLLNSDETDAVGGLPYLVELEGIRERGEIFHTYYFANKSDGEMAEKASYAKLYEPYHWIVATGDPLDNVMATVTQLEAGWQKSLTGLARLISLLLLSVFAVSTVIAIGTNRQYSQQVEREMEDTLAENEQVFRIAAQHSDRTLCFYDLQTRTARPWSEQDCAGCELGHICLKKYALSRLSDPEVVFPESREAAAAMLECIHSGAGSGAAHIHIAMPDGGSRWLEFKYSALSTGDKPTACLLSFADVSVRHEHELAYQRYSQSRGFDPASNLLYVECDLTEARVERLSGRLPAAEQCSALRNAPGFMQVFHDLGITFVKEEEAARHFSAENLQLRHGLGERYIEDVWQTHFADGSKRWLKIDITLVSDPYTGNLKSYLRLQDITAEHEATLSIQKRADYDAMTDLLRRDVGEARIQSLLHSDGTQGGALLAIDLDDLKGINDTLGHTEGDRAITGIASTLKSHFRKDDILVRAGGDEFLVFLPGVVAGRAPLEQSLRALMTKLSMLKVGKHEERAIRCSIGVAFEEPGVTDYPLLYQRADLALYHVKRSGRGHFAFYAPSMEEESLPSIVRQAPPVLQEDASDRTLRILLRAVFTHYPGVVLFRLTHDRFHILSVGSNVTDVIGSDCIERFWSNWEPLVHPDDWERVSTTFSREALLEKYARGENVIGTTYRNLEGEIYVRTEISATLYPSDEGDICACLLFRWAEQPDQSAGAGEEKPPV